MSTLHVNIIQPNSGDTPSIHTATTGSFDRIQNAAHGGNLNILTHNNIKLNALNNVEIRPGNALKASFFSAGNLRLNSPSSAPPSSILDVNGDITATEITASGNISSSGGTGSFGSLVVDGSSVDFSGLPTSDPGVAGRLYNDSGTIKISL